MGFIGRLAGLLIAGGLGGVGVVAIAFLLVGGMASRVPAGVWIFPGMILGLVATFVLVKYVLWRIVVIRPVLSWLYPYEEWTGVSD